MEENIETFVKNTIYGRTICGRCKHHILAFHVDPHGVECLKKRRILRREPKKCKYFEEE